MKKTIKDFKISMNIFNGLIYFSFKIVLFNKFPKNKKLIDIFLMHCLILLNLKYTAIRLLREIDQIHLFYNNLIN